MPVQRKQLATKRYVKSQLNKNLETKYHDHEVASIAVISAGTISSVSAMGRGTAPNQRVGDRISVTSLSFRLGVIRADTYNYVRCIFFQWNSDSTNDPPSLDEVLDPDSGLGVGVLVPFRNYKNDSIRQKKLRIIYDKLVRMDQIYQDTEMFVRKRITFKRPIQIVFNEDNPALLTGYGKIFLLLVSDSNVTTHPVSLGLTRITYKDA